MKPKLCREANVKVNEFQSLCATNEQAETEIRISFLPDLSSGPTPPSPTTTIRNLHDFVR